MLKYTDLLNTIQINHNNLLLLFYTILTNSIYHLIVKDKLQFELIV
jgi:hypothetical protein